MKIAKLFLVCFLLIFVTGLLFSKESKAATIYVDDDNTSYEDGSQEYPFNTIQEGINTAQSGDEVHVAGGSYPEDLNFKGGVALRGGYLGEDWSRDIEANLTLIEGLIRAEEDGKVDGLIEGFIIQGSISLLYDHSNEGRMIIARNTINATTYDSISIEWLENKVVIVRGNVIIGGPGNGFGALDCDRSNYFEFTNNVFANLNTCGILFVNCWAGMKINNNTIVGCGDAGIAIINIGKRRRSKFGRIAFNNIVIENLYGIDDDNLLDRDYNDVWNNGEDYYSCQPGPHDISRNPLFRDPENEDYRLFPGKEVRPGLAFMASPCIDAGIDVGLPYWGKAPDMGAYEFYPYFNPLKKGKKNFSLKKENFKRR